MAGSATPEIAGPDGAGAGGSATAGSGLGLAIVQRIVHGLFRNVEHSFSAIHRHGTTVTIVLPVSRPPNMKKRILVVEDDAALARVLRDNFPNSRGSKWTGSPMATRRSLISGACVLAGSRRARRDAAGPRRVHPLPLFRAAPGRADAVIVLLSARSQKADKLKGLHLGADDYVTKPFDLDELLARVHAVLPRRTRPSVDQLELPGPTSVSISGAASRAASAAPRDASDAPRVRTAALSRRTHTNGSCIATSCCGRSGDIPMCRRR